ncbi:toxin-antitoxin system YwqK family antitoxin [Bacteroides sp. OttesenSCG-928-D19]|nr:toxin-antitoxin system YwqK family antitoxin [Bacteroides sp. OttesenSCG-928-N06]MDL2304838.1 toxin-antitoxin system YwqK family antitoxin [Bacteroides sp. OttesenSCG-928-D19]
MRKIEITAIFLLLTTLLMGQSVVDTIYYDSNWKGVPDPIFAEYYTIAYFSDHSGYSNRFKSYWMTGELQSEGEFISIDKYDSEKSKVDGTCKAYYKNGRINQLAQFKKGMLEGESTLYYENGKIQLTAPYKDNKIHGMMKVYREDGKMERQIEYKDGVIDGIYTLYYDNGTIESTTVYVDGIQNGVMTKFNESGKKDYEAEYKNGITDGFYRNYFESGNYIQTNFIDQNPDMNNFGYYNSNGELIVGYENLGSKNSKRIGLSTPTISDKETLQNGIDYYAANGMIIYAVANYVETKEVGKSLCFSIAIENQELYPIETSISDVSVQYIDKKTKDIKLIDPKTIAEKYSKKSSKDIANAYKNAQSKANAAATVSSYGSSSNTTDNRIVSSGNTKSKGIAAVVDNLGYIAAAAGKSNSSTKSETQQTVNNWGFSRNSTVDGTTKYQVLEIENEKASKYAAETKEQLNNMIDALYYYFSVQPDELSDWKHVYTQHEKTKIIRLVVTINEIPYVFEWDYKKLKK